MGITEMSTKIEKIKKKLRSFEVERK